MASNKEQKQFDAINARLDAIDQTLLIRPKARSRWRIGYEWVINHKGTSSILAVILCLVGVFGGGYFKHWLDHKDDNWNRSVDDRILKVLSLPGGVNETLSSVKQTTTSTDATLKALSPFIQDVIRHQFESASKLPAAALQGRLPAIRNLLAVAKNQDLKIEPGITDSLSEKLLQVQPSATDFWQTAGDLISYRSFNAMSWNPSANLPNCVDFPPAITNQSVSFFLGGKPHKLQVSLATYRDCRITLDSPVDGEKLQSLLLGGVAKMMFYRCIVVYRGGPIKVALVWDNRVLDSVPGKNGGAVSISASGRTLSFTDCLFDFSIQQQTPPADVQQLTKSVLSQNPATINLPLAGHS